jgi:hypothetical protein
MRIRADSVFISSVLFTIALLNLIPAGRWYFFSGTDKVALARLDAGFRAEAQTLHYFGVACLTIILIGLIVICTGYVKCARSAWLVMFAVAGGVARNPARKCRNPSPCPTPSALAVA